MDGKQRRKRWLTPEIKQLEKMYIEGLPLQEICNYFNERDEVRHLKIPSLSAALRRYGIYEKHGRRNTFKYYQAKEFKLTFRAKCLACNMDMKIGETCYYDADSPDELFCRRKCRNDWLKINEERAKVELIQKRRKHTTRA